MKPQPVTAKGKYVLATGEGAANRLKILHDVYGPGARRILQAAGIKPGMRVVDLGCGVGMTTQLLAELVGPTGKVVGVDFSDAQLKQAQALLPDGHEHVEFVHASATATGLPPQSFDLVYSRFLLIHLVDPEAALKEMHSLLKPDGILVCEDGDLTSATSEPPSVFEKFSELWGRLGPKWGVDYTIGRRLYGLILKAHFSDLQITLNQPACSHGDGKRLFELSIAEAGDAFIEAGLISKLDLEDSLVEMRSLIDDKSVLAILPRMTQVWGRKLPSAA